MRVAIILPRIDQLGPVKVIQNLVNSLAFSENIFVKVFYIDKDVDQSLRMSVPVERLDRHNFPFYDFDIIHTNGIRPDLFAFLNRNKIRYHISTIHNFVFDDLAFTYNRLISLFFGNVWLIIWKRADKLICVSNAMKIYYEKWFSSEKLKVIYNGIVEPDKSFEPDCKIIEAIESFRSRGLKVLGTAGILTKRKGIDQILELLSIEKNLALVIIGDGKELRTLRRYSEIMKISDRCLFCGLINNAVNLFSYFDIFIMPSRSEGFGLALIEAVQQKVPVICSDIVVFKELLNDAEVTFFKLEDRTSLTEALKSVVESGKKKAETAYLRCINNYSASIMAKNYYELYKSAQ